MLKWFLGDYFQEAFMEIDSKKTQLEFIAAREQDTKQKNDNT